MGGAACWPLQLADRGGGASSEGVESGIIHSSVLVRAAAAGKQRRPQGVNQPAGAAASEPIGVRGPASALISLDAEQRVLTAAAARCAVVLCSSSGPVRAAAAASTVCAVIIVIAVAFVLVVFGHAHRA